MSVKRNAILKRYLGEIRERISQGPAELRAPRNAALDRLAALGLPHARMKGWRESDPRPITESFFHPPSDRLPEVRMEVIDQARLAHLSGPRLVFVNGRRLDVCSPPLPEGTTFESFGPPADNDAPEDNAFACLNAALADDGAVLKLAPEAKPEKLLHVLFLQVPGVRPRLSLPRLRIEAGRGAKATIVEEYVTIGAGNAMSNAVTLLNVEEGADVAHYRLQREGETAFHVGTVRARLARNAKLHTFSFSTGAALARHDLSVALEGEGAECTVEGIYQTRGSQTVDNRTLIDHAAPHTHSRQEYKGILTERSKAIFEGTIHVAPGAQRITADQSNPNLLLSDQARIHTRPQLEIFADDVKCRHGSTIGRIPEDPFFYLRSRGINAEEAKSILVYAFASELVDRLQGERLRTAMRVELHRRI